MVCSAAGSAVSFLQFIPMLVCDPSQHSTVCPGSSVYPYARLWSITAQHSVSRAVILFGFHHWFTRESYLGSPHFRYFMCHVGIIMAPSIIGYLNNYKKIMYLKQLKYPWMIAIIMVLFFIIIQLFHYYPGALILNRGQSCPLRDIWQCLKTLLLVTVGEGVIGI